MRIGVPKETAANERRVALVPDAVGRLVKTGLEVVVEQGAGAAAAFPDDAYRAAGAGLVATPPDVFGTSDVVLKVQPPSTAEVALCREGTALVAVFQPAAERDVVAALAARKVTAFSLALLPRITRAQPMDVLSSQATVAGYKAALLAATTAAIPGKRAPILITADAVRGMKPGAVIVDLAAETGGNCEVTEPGKDVRRDGVLVLGPLNLPSTVPLHASQMYARNVASFLLHVVQDGRLNLDFSDEIIRETCVTHAGEIRKS